MNEQHLDALVETLLELGRQRRAMLAAQAEQQPAPAPPKPTPPKS